MRNYIFVKSEYQIIRIDCIDILYIEGMSDYVRIYMTNGKTVMTLASIGSMIERLPAQQFVRVHRSYIVGRYKVEDLHRKRIYIGNKVIPVSDTYQGIAIQPPVARLMKVIAIDGELPALELITTYTSRIPYIQLLGAFTDVLEAADSMKTMQPDVLLLDRQLPYITGIRFLKSLNSNPLVIFTTAYNQYSVEGFSLHALDYVLKPFEFDRLLKAFNKAREYLDLRETHITAGSMGGNADDFISVKADYQIVKINFLDILFIESMSDYVRIYTLDNKTTMTLSSLSAIVEKLPEQDFMRVHRSYIVAVRRIDSVRRGRISIGDKVIPVGDSYTEVLGKVVNTQL